MPRPPVERNINFDPSITYFKPAGVPKRMLEEVTLEHDEFEAVRLKDKLGLNQNEAAKRMNISQSTFHRILFSGRGKIADAIIEGKSIKIVTQ